MQTYRAAMGGGPTPEGPTEALLQRGGKGGKEKQQKKDHAMKKKMAEAEEVEFDMEDFDRRFAEECHRISRSTSSSKQ